MGKIVSRCEAIANFKKSSNSNHFGIVDECHGPQYDNDWCYWFDKGYVMRQMVQAGVIALSFLLAGCGNEVDLGAPPPQHFVKQSPVVRAKQLATLNEYLVFGAFSVRIKNDTHIISYNWYHAGANTYTLKLSTPGDFYQAVLQDAGGRLSYWRDPTHVIRIRSLRQFMLAEMGWYIPLNRFYYWMRGMAAPGSSNAVTGYDAYGHLSTLQQNGWRLTYSRYINYGRYDLPTMIDVLSPRGDKVRIAVKQWTLYSGSRTSGLSKDDQQLLQSVG